MRESENKVAGAGFLGGESKDYLVADCLDYEAMIAGFQDAWAMKDGIACIAWVAEMFA